MKIRTLALACALSAALILVLGMTSRLMFEIFRFGWTILG